MVVILMRHGAAAERDPELFPDDGQRPLTAEGRKKSRQAARGMAALGMDVHWIFTSPLVRAVQTAEIAAAMLRVAADRVRETRHLAPGGSPSPLMDEVAAVLGTADRSESRRATRDGRVLLVGHEPDLSRLASTLLTGDAEGAAILFKKAAVCGIELDLRMPDRSGTLIFHIQPGMLRRAGGRS